jgi:carboxylate-amine ligase
MGTQRHTDKQRYNTIAHDLQVLDVAWSPAVHVHVGIDDNDERIEVMNELRAFLPLLLALSTSSPFWQGENTGLKSYRTAINDATPRNGMPEAFTSWGQYEHTINLLVRSGVIRDASQILDLRPRPLDRGTAHNRCLSPYRDAVCIAMLLAVCAGATSAASSESVHRTSLAFAQRNRWRAQRYGLDSGFIDPGAKASSTGGDDEVLDLIRDDAEFFSSTREVDHARLILERGTSADRQLALYQDLLGHGITSAKALEAVIDSLVVETGANLNDLGQPLLA